MRARPPWRRGPQLWGTALILSLFALGLSVWLIGAPPPRKIVLATGDPDGGFAALGHKYQARLQRLRVQVELVSTTGSLENLHLLQEGKADAAFVQAGAAALTGDEGTCGLAAVGPEPLWIFARAGLAIPSSRELNGHTVAIGPRGSGTEALSRALLAEYGVSEGVSTRLINLSMGEVRAALHERTIDAAMLVCGPAAPAVADLLQDRQVRLVRLDCSAALVQRLPYLRPVVLPRGALDLKNVLPADDVPLLAPATVLAAREGLHPRVVEQLLMAAKAVRASDNHLDGTGGFPTLEGVDLPIHVAAQRFMTSGESFLSRALPYWGVRLVVQAQLLLLPTLALLLPFGKALPWLWSFRIHRILRHHYAALADVEIAIDRANNPGELRHCLQKLDRLRNELESLSRKLPGHWQRDVYHWRLHVALVRTEAPGAAALSRIGRITSMSQHFRDRSWPGEKRRGPGCGRGP